MPLRGHVMLTPFDASSGAALTSATVNVYSPGTVTPVAGTLFDKSGGTLSNPLTSDATTGLVDFYMNVAQEVDLQVAKAGFTTRTYSNVPVLDDAGNDLTALMTGVGDIVYSSAASTPARLAIGATGSFLTNTGANTPGWSNTISAGGLTISSGGITITAGGLQVTGGNIGIGVPANAATALILSGSLTNAATQFGIDAEPTFASTGTTEGSAIAARATTAASAFTMTLATAFHALSGSKGAGSAITTAVGLDVDAQTVGGTNNYGVRIAAPSGGATDNIALNITGGGFKVLGTYGFANAGVALGGGASATNGTIGGSGPATAGQNGWMAIQVGGVNSWLPYWR